MTDMIAKVSYCSQLGSKDPSVSSRETLSSWSSETAWSVVREQMVPEAYSEALLLQLLLLPRG